MVVFTNHMWDGTNHLKLMHCVGVCILSNIYNIYININKYIYIRNIPEDPCMT